MNKEGIQKFLSVAKVGMVITLGGEESGCESYTYHGELVALNEDHLIIKHERAGYTFEATIKYRNIWWHSLETQLKK